MHAPSAIKRVTSMTAAPHSHSNSFATAGRLAGLGPRSVLALSEWLIGQARALGGLDYSLIDYQGVVAAAARFNIEWWLDPQRSVAALSELWWRNLSLVANQASGVPSAS